MSLVGIPGTIHGVPVPRLDDQSVRRHLQAVQQQIADVYAKLAQRVNDLVVPVVLSTVTGVAPSATLNTYGTQTVVSPPSGYASLFAFAYLAATSGGTFGAETLTVRVTLTMTDGTTKTGTKTFVAAGNETAFSGADLFAMLTTGLSVASVAVDCQSTINNSTATGGMKVACWAS